MDFDFQIVLGLLAAAVGLLGYVLYYRDILFSTTKPHPFSWLAFALLTGIAFVAQVVEGGGPGAWVMGLSSVATLGIAVLALRQGEKRITLFDWFCFLGSLFGIGLWVVTDNPLSAVIIVTIVDSVAFAPTYRKAWLRPHEESINNFFLSAVKYSIGLPALTVFSLTTALFPISLVITNFGFVVMVLWRRRQLRALAARDSVST